LKGSRAERFDMDAVAAIVIGAVVNFRRTEWTFGAPPLDLDEDRFVATLVESLMVLLDAVSWHPDHDL
jgi:hypothetical protein